MKLWYDGFVKVLKYFSLGVRPTISIYSWLPFLDHWIGAKFGLEASCHSSSGNCTSGYLVHSLDRNVSCKILVFQARIDLGLWLELDAGAAVDTVGTVIGLGARAIGLFFTTWTWFNEKVNKTKNN